MLIRLSEEQERLLMQWISPITEAEWEADIEPSGYEIRIEIAPPFAPSATAIKGECTLELGDVYLELSS